MPWREDPKPYHIWISEIMLQQTRVEAVYDYYLRFLKRLPDIECLAKIDEDELHKLWEGLGYYNRAKNLKKAARILVEEYAGELPSTYDELLKLPGIGPYTAGAIASIAFHQNVPAVDGNVMRVVSRLTGDNRDILQQSTKKAMEDIVSKLILPDEVHHFNQALMELGALVCVPNGHPKCEVCPVADLCYAYEKKKTDELPVKKAKKERRIEERTVFIFVNEKNEFLIQKRGAKGLLAGLWEFISVEGEVSEPELQCLLKHHPFRVETVLKIESSKHIFSHIEWYMQGYLIRIRLTPPSMKETKKDRCSVREGAEYDRSDLFFPDKEQVWCDLKALKEEYSIPAAFKTYVTSIEEGLVRNSIQEGS